jgi:trans-aconitate methyltransferase
VTRRDWGTIDGRMSDRLHPDVDWHGWLRRWDRQQEGYVLERETRFTAMLDVLSELLPAKFVALDLGSGPGSISQRLLARFPEARSIALDMDPVMLALGQGALGTLEGRLRWINADLASGEWLAALGDARIEAVLSSTALHWLEPETLMSLYQQLGRLLPTGGVFLNADHLAFGSETPALARLSQRALDEQWSNAAFAARGIETAEQWWEAAAMEPALTPLLREREALLATKRRPASTPTFDAHVAGLRDAGFREVGSIWQVLSDRVLVAVR